MSANAKAFLPLDIRPAWMNPIRRLQSVAKAGNQGCAILHITIVVNAEGDPVYWTNPRRTLIEPKLKADDFIREILNRDF